MAELRLALTGVSNESTANVVTRWGWVSLPDEVAVSFSVYRSDNADMSSPTKLDTVDPDDPWALVDSGLAEAIYYYQVQADDGLGAGPVSNIAKATVRYAPVPASAPTQALRHHMRGL